MLSKEALQPSIEEGKVVPERPTNPLEVSLKVPRRPQELIGELSEAGQEINLLQGKDIVLKQIRALAEVAQEAEPVSLLAETLQIDSMDGKGVIIVFKSPRAEEISAMPAPTADEETPEEIALPPVVEAKKITDSLKPPPGLEWATIRKVAEEYGIEVRSLRREVTSMRAEDKSRCPMFFTRKKSAYPRATLVAIAKEIKRKKMTGERRHPRKKPPVSPKALETTKESEPVKEKWRRFVVNRDPELRRKLILQYVHLVSHVVHRMGYDGSPPFDKEDLVSDGILGLISAVDRFDPERGLQFATYAFIRIRGQILDALRTRDLLPRPARQRVKQLQNATTELTGTLGRPPTEEQLANHLGLSLSQLQQALLDASFEIWSMDAPLSDDAQGFCLQNVLKSPGESEPAARQEMAELRDQVRDALYQLPHRQKVLLSLYYCEELTMNEIGKILRISESRVSQLHVQAIRDLRSLLRTQGIEVLAKARPKIYQSNRARAANRVLIG